MIGVLKLNIYRSLECPKCNGNYFEVKREATYLYTYKLETPPADNNSEDQEALPFLFDNREKIGSKEYLQCESCGTQYPCDLDELSGKIYFTILQKAIRSDSTEKPEFLG
jgi:hypothetical protein